MKTVTFIVLFVIVVAVNSAVDFSSCARMDVPGLSKVAQGLCISSCKYQQYEKNLNIGYRYLILTFQNCGTGSCVRRRGRKTCVCSRCGGGGGSWPSV
uniref:Uncharacterized protein n=1 Tax=Parascaris equorum TaxID=6256 RepID=A0A914RVS4_PAREQ